MQNEPNLMVIVNIIQKKFYTSNYAFVRTGDVTFNIFLYFLYSRLVQLLIKYEHTMYYMLA